MKRSMTIVPVDLADGQLFFLLGWRERLERVGVRHLEVL